MDDTENKPKVQKKPDSRKRPRAIPHEKCVITVYAQQDESVVLAQGILLDMSAGGIGFYSNHAIPPNTDVVIEFQGNFYKGKISGKTIWKRKITSPTRIIKQEPQPEWHLGVQFFPRTPEEEDLIKLFNK